MLFQATARAILGINSGSKMVKGDPITLFTMIRTLHL